MSKKSNVDVEHVSNSDVKPNREVLEYLQAGIALRESPQLSRQKLLNRLLVKLQPTDLTLRLGDTELRAHRYVLAAFSPVFRCMLSNQTFQETQLGVVEIKDVRVEVMEAALRLMHGKRLGTVGTKTLMDLLILAERYEIVDVKELCENMLAKDESVDLLELLALASAHNASTLLEAALDRAASDRGIILTLHSLRGREFILSHPELVVLMMDKMQHCDPTKLLA